MFKTITSLLAKRPTLHAELELDHLETSPEQLILGMRLTWRNDTPEPLDIQEVRVILYHLGKKQTPVPLNYNGRFVRIPYQKGITKIAGANSFRIRPGARQVESLRFLTREIDDLKDGTYTVELLTTVADGTYLHDFEIKVAPQIKLQASAPTTETAPLGNTNFTAYSRALRIGLKPDLAK